MTATKCSSPLLFPSFHQRLGGLEGEKKKKFMGSLGFLFTMFEARKKGKFIQPVIAIQPLTNQVIWRKKNQSEKCHHVL